MKLTDTQLRRWRPKKRSELLDGNGLILRASPNGKRTWTVRYRFNGKRHRIEVGSYPDMSLAEARAKLAEIKIDIAAGHDPQLARLEDAVTFPEVYQAWLKHCENVYSDLSLYTLELTYENHILPYWRTKIFGALRPKDLSALMNRALEIQGKQPGPGRGRRGGPGAARNVQKYANKMAKWARSQGLIEVNYFAGMQAPYTYVERTRTPTVEEVRHIMARMKEHIPYPYGPFVQLIALTGLRRGELKLAEWSWLEDDALVVPTEATKMKRAPHVIPLTDQMRALLEELPRWKAYLFAITGDKPLAGWTAAMNKVRANCDVEHFVLHDFRRSMATEMGRLRVPGDVIERCLGHTQPQMQRAYRKYEYFDEKREAWQKWNDALATNQTADIIAT